MRIVHLMPTFKACRDIYQSRVESNLLNPPTDDLHPNWHWLGASVDRTRWKFSFPGGSWLHWFGAREADASRGLRVDIVTLDEADGIDTHTLDGIIKPWFSEPWSLRMLLIGGTPLHGRYGLLYRSHKEGLDGARLREAGDTENKLARKYSFHASYEDAPETVDQAYVAAVKADTPAEVFDREWRCSFDSGEGLVYPMFREDFHVREPHWNTAWSEIGVGVDFGWSDAGVYLIFGVLGHGRDATAWALDEVYETQKAPSWWQDQARRIQVQPRYANARWFADPSRPEAIADLRRLCNVRIEASVKHEIEDGVMAVADRLIIRQSDPDDDKTKYSRLYVSPKCKNFIREMGLYRRKRDSKNKDLVLDEIEDKHNHCVDSARYWLFSRFGGPPRTVTGSGAGYER